MTRICSLSTTNTVRLKFTLVWVSGEDDDDKNSADYTVVHWEVVNSQAPPGLEAYLPKAEDDDGRTMYFAGTPEFIGRWCFNLRADISSNPRESGTVSITQMICFEGERNENDEHYEYLRMRQKPRSCSGRE